MLAFIPKAAKTAGNSGEKIYLVGGAVGGILLGYKIYDIDLTVEGDAIALAGKLADKAHIAGLHPEFNTAKIEIPGGSIINIARM